MVAIARALQDVDTAARCVLVLDEPTAALPATQVDLLLDGLVRHTTMGHTVLYVTHRLEEVSRVAARVTVLRSGVVVGVLDAPGLARDDLIELMIGGRLEAADDHDAVPTSRGSVVLDVRELSGGNVRSAGFALHGGEILGIAGLLGSGRSSILRMLSGVMARASGTIRIDGSAVRIRNPADARAAGIAYVPEDRREAAFEHLSVLENISMPSLAEYWRRARLRPGRERADVQDATHAFRITAASIDSPLASLSGGNQQKALLARWLRRRPRVILLDEPTQGVDVATRQEIYALLRGAVRQGAGAIVVSSEYEELEALCDRVLILRNGRIIGEVERGVMLGRSLHELESAVGQST
jgi:ribose transport system ATP-binding protein